MTLDYFYGQSGELFSYFRIPKALFHTKISFIVRTKIESEACQWTPQNALPLTACSLPLF